MKLIDVSTVREALRFDSIARNDAAIALAVETATTQLESATRRKFKGRGLRDVFRLYMPMQFGLTYSYRLALTEGFLRAAPTVTYATDRATLESDPSEFDATQILVNRELGEVIIESAASLNNLFVAVEYACGLDFDGQTNVYDTGDHQWLADAALAYAVDNLISSNPDMAGGDKGPKKDATGAKAAIMPVVVGKMRYFASAIRPVISGELNV